MCVYVCVCIWVYMCTYVCFCAYINICMCMCMYVYVCMCVCICVCLCVCMCVCIYVYVKNFPPSAMLNVNAGLHAYTFAQTKRCTYGSLSCGCISISSEFSYFSVLYFSSRVKLHF